MLPLTDEMRRDLIEAMEADDAPNGEQIAENTNHVVSRSTVSKVRKNRRKKEITWEQWSLIAREVGLVPERYLPSWLTDRPAAAPEWRMPPSLEQAITKPRDRRLIERAMEKLLEAGRSS